MNKSSNYSTVHHPTNILIDQTNSTKLMDWDDEIYEWNYSLWKWRLGVEKIEFPSCLKGVLIWFWSLESLDKLTVGCLTSMFIMSGSVSSSASSFSYSLDWSWTLKPSLKRFKFALYCFDSRLWALLGLDFLNIKATRPLSA